ncbi:hypothetical protein ACFVYA_31370 [Amycolatopsis sp. NPDC058278]|uniref:hypothetical protein n=1 Tax=Amycolatopsis sp. NPDC058278 TaxID=3346417 RepID=UPI0036DBC754
MSSSRLAVGVLARLMGLHFASLVVAVVGMFVGGGRGVGSSRWAAMTLGSVSGSMTLRSTSEAG